MPGLSIRATGRLFGVSPEEDRDEPNYCVDWAGGCSRSSLTSLCSIRRMDYELIP